MTGSVRGADGVTREKLPSSRRKDRLAMPVIRERAAPADAMHHHMKMGETVKENLVPGLCGFVVLQSERCRTSCTSHLIGNDEQTYDVEGSSSRKAKSLGEEQAGPRPFLRPC
jgi:hypothetical protein